MTTQQTGPTGRIVLKNVRLAFPALWKAETVNGGDTPRFSAVFILPPDHPQLAELEKKMEAVAVEKWGKKADAMLKSIKAGDKTCLHEGDNKPDYDGFEGNLFISAAADASSKPGVFDRDKTALTENDGVIYAGCYVNGSIDLWAQDNKWGKRVNAQLRGVQFVRDGDAFSAGRPATADEFEEVVEGADAEDLT